MKLQAGDLVTRKSYNHDLLFRIASIHHHTAILYGEDIRLVADAEVSDLVKVSERDLKKRKKADQAKQDFSYRLFRQDYQLMKEKRDYKATEGFQDISYFHLPAKVLHLDGDPLYLKKCIDLYRRLGLQVHGVHVSEKKMAAEIGPLIEKIQPNILVITGHDSFMKSKGAKEDLKAYRHSKHFQETVREARRIVSDLDQLIIFAGACQSHFESLIKAGANFASSPLRVNIHALDPVYVVAKIAYTPFMETVNVWEALRNTLTGEKGMGGIETKGLMRIGMPFIEDLQEEK